MFCCYLLRNLVGYLVLSCSPPPITTPLPRHAPPTQQTTPLPTTTTTPPHPPPMRPPLDTAPSTPHSCTIPLPTTTATSHLSLLAPFPSLPLNRSARQSPGNLPLPLIRELTRYPHLTIRTPPFSPPPTPSRRVQTGHSTLPRPPQGATHHKPRPQLVTVPRPPQPFK